MNIIHHTVSAAVVPLSALVGSKTGAYVAATESLPSWVTPLLGPAGGLICTLLAIRWLLARLDKAESKAEVRDDERAKNFAILATMTTQNQAVIEQNSEVLAEVKTAIAKCAEMKS